MAALPYPRPSSSAASAVMRANKSRDTRPEVRLRSALHRRGLRFRKSYLVRTGSARVNVDVAFPSLKIAVFVDGCFWHGVQVTEFVLRSIRPTGPRSCSAMWSGMPA